jgi:hypothetical protein
MRLRAQLGARAQSGCGAVAGDCTYRSNGSRQTPTLSLSKRVSLLTVHRSPSIFQKKNEMEVIGRTLFELWYEVKIEVACFPTLGMYQ